MLADLAGCGSDTVNWQYELLFCVQNPHDAPAVAALCAQHEHQTHVRARVFVGVTPVGLNPKINNMAAAFDAGIAVWTAKNKYDAVRPFSAIHFLNKNKKVTAWGGVGKGTVHDMPGEDWRPYLQTADHTEYPSASSCFCAAHAEASRRYFHSDSLGWNIPYAQGSSEIEPGSTTS